MADNDLTRGQSTAQAAAVAAIAKAYGVSVYAAGTWQRKNPKLLIRAKFGTPVETQTVQFHIHHDPKKVRQVSVTVRQHHSGGFFASLVIAHTSALSTSKVFEGSMNGEGQFETWERDPSLLNVYF